MTSQRPDLDNLQANIVYGCGRWRYACYVFLRTTNRAGAQKVIREVTRSSHFGVAASQQADRADSNINIAITHQGLHILDSALNDTSRFRGRHTLRSLVEADALDEISAFEGGMRSADLGDAWPVGAAVDYEWPQDGTPASAWWSGDPRVPWEHTSKWPHLLVWISAKSSEVRTDVYAELEAIVKGTDGVTEAGRQYANAFNEKGDPENLAREHFGFIDGISQPAIEGLRPGNPGDGKLGARGWKGLKVGEFFLGYEDEAYRPPGMGSLPNWARDGTFLVYRKLQQDVGAFRKAAEDIARISQHSSEDVEQALMGRKKDGSPLLVPPGAPAVPAVDKLKNDFTYAGDRRGLKCPLGSHVRRSNPRDDLHFEGRRVNSHRVIRRGMTYGSRYDDAPEEDHRGLIFIAFNSRIEDQFEFIQKQWLNRGATFRIGDDADPIAGVGENIRIVINGEQPVLHQVERPFTRFLGGEYFFVPSIAGLEHIAPNSETSSADSTASSG